MRIIEERVKVCWLAPGVDGIFAEIRLEEENPIEEVFILAGDAVEDRSYSVSKISFFDDTNTEHAVLESYEKGDAELENSDYYEYFAIADRLLDQFHEDRR